MREKYTPNTRVVFEFDRQGRTPHTHTPQIKTYVWTFRNFRIGYLNEFLGKEKQVVFSPRPISIGGDVVLDYVPVELGCTHAMSCAGNSKDHSTLSKLEGHQQEMQSPRLQEGRTLNSGIHPFHTFGHIAPYVSSRLGPSDANMESQVNQSLK